MERINDKPSGLIKSTLEGIEIRLWNIYLARNGKNLHHVLSSYSLDNGPVQKAIHDSDRVFFRFTTYDWKRSILPMFREYHIQYEIMNTFYIDSDQYSLRKKVYVAEDDLNILFALNTILEQAGYDVLLSHCGQPFLEPNLPATDLFILDRSMPGVDGIEICKHLRTRAYTKDTPVIMISASPGSAREAFDAGVNDFLEKPFEMKDLLRLVAKHTAAKAREDFSVELH